MLKLVAVGVLLALVSLVHSQDGFASQNGGTTGGQGGSTVNVGTQAELIAAVTGNDRRIVRITRHIALTQLIRPGSNKSILGGSSTAGISGSGFYIRRQSNVIIRGLRLYKCIAPDDCVSIDESTNVWVDHNDFYSDKTHGKDYYDGLLDVSHAADFVTVSWNRFHDHYKTSLVGHSDNNGAEDRGKLRISYHHNYFYNCESRMPSLRFGTGHIYNNIFENIEASTINSRMGAQVLVENNVFVNAKRTIITNLDSSQDGFAVERGNDFGGVPPTITQVGSFTRPPYSYSLDSLASVRTAVRSNSGATIIF